MPLRKEIRELEDLCLHSILHHIPQHAQNFERCKSDSPSLIFYEITQRVLSYKLSKVLERIHYEGDGYARLLGVQENLSCLRFLLNHHTVEACITLFRKVFRFSPENFLQTLHSCKDIKILQIRNSRFSIYDFHSYLQGWRNLLKIDLFNSTCGNDTFMAIVENCPEIQVLRLTGQSITDDSLLNLCRTHRNSKSFRFCDERGNCCSLGKKLVSLTLYGTRVETDGLTCALQHLKSLKELEDGVLYLDSGCQLRHFFSTVHVYNAVETLRHSYESQGLPHPELRLQTLLIPFNVSYLLDGSAVLCRVLGCCPNLRALRIDIERNANGSIFTIDCFQSLRELWLAVDCSQGFLLDSSQYFQQFLLTTGKQLQTVSLSGGSVSLKLIRIILRNCPILTEFHLGYKTCFRQLESSTSIISADTDNLENDAFDCFGYVKNLEKIWLSRLSLRSKIAEQFLRDLLIEARNVRILTVCDSLVEKSVKEILEANEFSKLEEISLRDADLADVSLKPLLKYSSSLKKITYAECKNAVTFVKKHKEIARVHNFQVMIEALPSRLS